MHDPGYAPGMRRIAIVGCGGAGKSTLARALGERLGLPVIHLDVHFWKPGWTEPPDDEWARVHDGLLEGDAWIIDGNFGGTQEARMARADTILFLDVPRRVCLWGALRRVVRYRGRSRPDLGAGCPEKFDLPFLRWIWLFERDTRPEIVARLERHAEAKRVVTLRSRREIARFLESL
jgi:adenylate kinase family enzyme